MGRPPVINIVAGLAFTRAQVGDDTVAVYWGKATGGPYYLSDGKGLPREFDDEGQAASALLATALAYRDDGPGDPPNKGVTKW